MVKRFVAEHLPLVVAGCAGLALFLALYGPAFMGGVRPQPLGRTEVERRALEFAAAEGWSAASRIATSRPLEGDDAAAARAAGAGEVDRELLPDPSWEVDVLPGPAAVGSSIGAGRLPDPILTMALTPAGEVVQYVESTSPIAATPLDQFATQRMPPFAELDTARIFDIPDESRRPLPDEERERALGVAREFFARHAIPVDGAPAEAAAFEGQDEALQTHFTWTGPGPSGTEQVVRVAVWKDRVVAFDLDVLGPRPPKPGLVGTIATSVMQTLQSLGYLLGAALIAALVIFKRRLGEIDFRSAFSLFLFYATATLVLALLGFSVFFGVTLAVAGTNNVWAAVATNLVSVFFVATLFGLMLAGAWAVGEGQAYLVWPRSMLRPFSALMRGNFRTPEAAPQVAAGYLLAFAALGVVAVVGVVTPASDRPSAAPLMALMSWPVWLSPACSAFVTALNAPLFAGYFAMTYVRSRTNRLWVVLAAGIVATLALRFVVVPEQIFPGSATVGVVLGLVFAAALPFVFVRYGPLTQLVAVFAFLVAVAYYPLVLTDNAGHAASGAWGLAFGLVPAAVAAYGVWRPAEERAGEAVPAHVRRALDRLRIAEEFDVARQVQLRLLPDAAPEQPGLEVAGTCVPANEVGGDYYDYFRLEDGSLGIAIGDVSGKGVGAAIYMTLTKSYMVTQTPRARDLVGVLSRVNDHLRRNLARGTFVTLAYAVVEAGARRLSYTRAGHNPPLLIRATGEGDFLSAPGVALGAVGSRTFESATRAESVELQPGDLLLLYTDGVTEAMNPSGDEYGEERLAALSRRLAVSHAPPAAVIDAILRDVRAFAGRRPQNDDITLVAVRVR